MRSAGKDSTWGLGRTRPAGAAASLPDGSCRVPLGPASTADRAGLSLQYNEYIVYHLDQARMRFLVRVRFCYS